MPFTLVINLVADAWQPAHGSGHLQIQAAGPRLVFTPPSGTHKQPPPPCTTIGSQSHKNNFVVILTSLSSQQRNRSIFFSKMEIKVSLPKICRTFHHSNTSTWWYHQMNIPYDSLKNSVASELRAMTSNSWNTKGILPKSKEISKSISRMFCIWYPSSWFIS